MHQICILAPAEHIVEIRNTASSMSHFSDDPNKLLTIKLSADGKDPATYYFCAFNYSKNVYNDILNLKKHTEVFVGDPKEFLTSKNLKVII